MTESTLFLLLAFQVKHLLADYYLQFPYMYQNKGAKKDWFWPLFDHAGTHGLFTIIILISFFMLMEPEDVGYALSLVFALSFFDFITHFITDRWKATRGRTPKQSKFWYDLGIDQMIHHIVSIVIVFEASRII